MSVQSDSGLDGTLLALVRHRLVRCRVEVRRSVASGVGWLILAAVLLTLGGLCLAKFGGVGVAVAVGLGLLGVGLWNLTRGLVWVLDREPVLVLGADALIDRRRQPEAHYPWSMIRRARLARTTRNGADESAVLALELSGLASERSVEIDLMSLDHSAQEIFRLVGVRADLS